jgi:uncharacterized protein (UPF0548 family)
MLSIWRPSRERIDSFRREQNEGPLSYAAVGATRGEPPPGFDVDHHRVQLGEGAATFARARAALRAWQMFRLGWVEPCWPDTPIEPGAAVAVLAHLFGLWGLNACRIVYTIDETGPVEKFGFAYGTLQDHIESGEERFTVEWNHADDSVWYDLLAFSRPHHWTARLGYFLVRRVQKRFARDSLAAMLRAVRA